jgi:endonuclease/exonuclease/phosphatase family metal-dependent hydrolase
VRADLGREAGVADRSYRRLCAAVAGGLIVLLVGCTAMATGPNAVVAPAPAPPSAVGDIAATPVRVLQLNLCNSGIAGCYTGRAAAAAAAVIRAETPDLVTVNEVCQDDMPTLQQALAEAVPDSAVTSAFQPARNAGTEEPYRCRNGRQYGIGIVSRWPTVSEFSSDRGIYPAQDADDPEQRAWLCLDVAATPTVSVCTTHLAYTKREIAGAQCRYLFDTVITGMRARDGAAPLVLGGDLNLGSGDSPDLEACLPAGYELVDDGGQQHVVATPDLVAADSRTIDLDGSTDHPGLLVTLTHRAS